MLARSRLHATNPARGSRIASGYVAYSYIKCPLLARNGLVRSFGSLRWRILASSATHIRGGNLHFINRTCRPPVGGLYVLHFYDRENRGAHQDIVHGIYFGLFLEWLIDLKVQTAWAAFSGITLPRTGLGGQQNFIYPVDASNTFKMPEVFRTWRPAFSGCENKKTIPVERIYSYRKATNGFIRVARRAGT